MSTYKMVEAVGGFISGRCVGQTLQLFGAIYTVLRMFPDCSATVFRLFVLRLTAPTTIVDEQASAGPSFSGTSSQPGRGL